MVTLRRGACLRDLITFLSASEVLSHSWVAKYQLDILSRLWKSRIQTFGRWVPLRDEETDTAIYAKSIMQALESSS